MKIKIIEKNDSWITYEVFYKNGQSRIITTTNNGVYGTHVSRGDLFTYPF
jgi:hypothetical protein